MKKTSLVMACLVGLALMASCKKDVQPTINPLVGEGYLTENAEIYTAKEYTIGYVLNGEKLTEVEIVISLNGEFVSSSSLSLDQPNTYTASFPISSDNTGTLTIRGTVTDAKGHTATTSTTVTCIEQPNAKFLGNYEGNALISGTLNIIPNNMDTIPQELQDEPIAVKLHIASGDDVDEVIATVTINDQESPNLINGTVEGNKVTFEAINAPFNLDYEYSGMNINIPLDMTYDITGTLNNGTLDLEGGCKGNGTFNVFIFSGSVDLDGSIGGSLTKTE